MALPTVHHGYTKKLTADESGNATVVIYYSEHSWRTNSGGHAAFHLIPYNVKDIGLATSALSAQVFADTINELQPRRLFVALNRCPQRTGPLCKGRLRPLVVSAGGTQLGYERESEILKCPWHQ